MRNRIVRELGSKSVLIFLDQSYEYKFHWSETSGLNKGRKIPVCWFMWSSFFTSRKTSVIGNSQYQNYVRIHVSPLTPLRCTLLRAIRCWQCLISTSISIFIFLFLLLFLGIQSEEENQGKSSSAKDDENKNENWSWCKITAQDKTQNKNCLA